MSGRPARLIARAKSFNMQTAQCPRIEGRAWAILLLAAGTLVATHALWPVADPDTVAQFERAAHHRRNAVTSWLAVRREMTREVAGFLTGRLRGIDIDGSRREEVGVLLAEALAEVHALPKRGDGPAADLSLWFPELHVLYPRGPPLDSRAAHRRVARALEGRVAVSEIDDSGNLFMGTVLDGSLGVLTVRFDATHLVNAIRRPLKGFGGSAVYVANREPHRGRIVFAVPPTDGTLAWRGKGANYEASSRALERDEGMGFTTSYGKGLVLSYWASVEPQAPVPGLTPGVLWGVVAEIPVSAIKSARWRLWHRQLSGTTPNGTG